MAAAKRKALCVSCLKEGGLRCVRCKTVYCSKECQVRDYTDGLHKSYCRAVELSKSTRAEDRMDAKLTLNVLSGRSLEKWSAGAFEALPPDLVLKIGDDAPFFGSVAIAGPDHARLAGSDHARFARVPMLGKTPYELLQGFASARGSVPGDCQTFLRLLGLPRHTPIAGSIVMPWGNVNVDLVPEGMEFISSSDQRMHKKVLCDPLFGDRRGRWVVNPGDVTLWGVWGGRLRSAPKAELMNHVWEGILARCEELRKETTGYGSVLGDLGQLFCETGAGPALYDADGVLRIAS